MASIRDMMDLNRADFETVERDFADITERLLSNDDFVKLMYFNSEDCLTNEDLEVTPEILEEVTQENLRIVPFLKIPKNKGSYTIITFDRFAPNPHNPEFMNNFILIDVLCPVDSWMMDSYMMRPFHMMHIVQEELNDKPLNGIGKVHFTTASLLNLGDYVGYQMVFSVINDA